MTDTHLLIRWDQVPNMPDTFFGICGESGTEKQQFKQDVTEIRKGVSVQVVTCEKCLEKIGVKHGSRIQA